MNRRRGWALAGLMVLLNVVLLLTAQCGPASPGPASPGVATCPKQEPENDSVTSSAYHNADECVADKAHLKMQAQQKCEADCTAHCDTANTACVPTLCTADASPPTTPDYNCNNDNTSFTVKASCMCTCTCSPSSARNVGQ